MKEPESEPSKQQIEDVFRALLDWDLRVSFGPSPGGRLYTVATEPEDGERVELLVGANAAELAAWVANRQTRELSQGLNPASPATSVDLRIESILKRISGLYFEFHTLRSDIADLTADLTNLASGKDETGTPG